MDLQTIEHALAVRALVQINETTRAVATSEASEKVKDNELFARMKLDMIKAHMEYLAFFLMRS